MAPFGSFDCFHFLIERNIHCFPKTTGSSLSKKNKVIVIKGPSERIVNETLLFMLILVSVSLSKYFACQMNLIANKIQQAIKI